ncbi:MAG: dihydrodipicolinate reductase [Novosphingobium sp.]
MTEAGRVMRIPDPRKTYRVVQWATGRVGAVTLRDLIRSPQMELVGVYVHSPEKDGKDAGELAGMAPVGVRATRNIEQIIALKPDCVLGVQEGDNVEDVCRFLEAGINVATSRVAYVDPDTMDPEIRRRVEVACRKGGASIHASGASPGFGSEALGLLAVSMSRTMDCMTIDEFADFPKSCPDFQITATGFGSLSDGGFNPHILDHVALGFRQSVNVIAKALGIVLDEITVTGEGANARNDYILPGGTAMGKGTLGAMRVTVAGVKDGKEIVRHRLNWYSTRDVDRDWDLRDSGWRVLVEGDNALDIVVTFPISPEKYSPAMAGNTGFRVLNAIPAVCAADPGIVTTADLPHIVPIMG